MRIAITTVTAVSTASIALSAREGMPATADGKEIKQKVTESGPCSLFVFKTTADAFSGRISYFKVITGVLKNDANLNNVAKGSAERLSHIGVPVGKTITPVTELRAGDIGAVAKLKDTLTGDTLADKGFTAAYTSVKLPEPSIAFAIEAKSRQDEDRVGNAVHRILEEDQSLRFYRDPQTREFLLAGSGLALRSIWSKMPRCVILRGWMKPSNGRRTRSSSALAA